MTPRQYQYDVSHFILSKVVTACFGGGSVVSLASVSHEVSSSFKLYISLLKRRMKGLSDRYTCRYTSGKSFAALSTLGGHSESGFLGS